MRGPEAWTLDKDSPTTNLQTQISPNVEQYVSHNASMQKDFRQSLNCIFLTVVSLAPKGFASDVFRFGFAPSYPRTCIRASTLGNFQAPIPT